jgi:hypothetical protein
MFYPTTDLRITSIMFHYQVWPNGTGNGMWGNVAMDVAIMGFGATYAWLENYAYLDYSLPYFRSSVRCLTPQPQKLPGWMTPLLPFSHTMWLAVGISILIITASLHLVTRAIMSSLGKYSHHSSNNLYIAMPTFFKEQLQVTILS